MRVSSMNERLINNSSSNNNNVTPIKIFSNDGKDFIFTERQPSCYLVLVKVFEDFMEIRVMFVIN